MAHRLPNANVHDYSGAEWRLRDTPDGRQIWDYEGPEVTDDMLEHELEKHAEAVKRLVAKQLDDRNAPRLSANDPRESVRKAIEFYGSLQSNDGHWASDYGGPMFLMPGLIFTLYISQTEIPRPHRMEMLKYLTMHQRTDGGWGLHIEGPSTMFGTTMNYCALRVLGVKRDDPRAVAGRKWIQDHGGATETPSWGKFWLATLGVLDWNGFNPVPPELWWLPNWLPFHPSRFWCHCRVVYLPMAYVFGCRGTAPLTPLIKELREELYTVPYEKVPFAKTRNACCPVDVYQPHTKLYEVVNKVLVFYEKIHSRWARKKALAKCIDHIHHEDETTRYIDIGPVNKVINMLSVYFAEGKSERYWKHYERLFDYLYVSDDGMKMAGYNGSQLWDTAFAVQAIVESGMIDEFEPIIRKAQHFIDITQVREDVDHMSEYYRHISDGAWPFSTKDHGWPISDCTSEGLKAVLQLRDIDRLPKLEDERLFKAVNVILSFQNKDGGWATYENTRGSKLLELLNPSEVFENIMIDYTHVECTSASIQALTEFAKRFPEHRTREIQTSIAHGVVCLKKMQRTDGGWYGFWAVCFTYAAWFGVEGLVKCGVPKDDPAIKRACEFLVRHQRPDGGWGESYLSCVKHEYMQHPNGAQPPNTAWALLALMAADYPDVEVIHRGARNLMQQQFATGEWSMEGIMGVFNSNCMITYHQYRMIFPIWALSRYMRKYASQPSRL